MIYNKGNVFYIDFETQGFHLPQLLLYFNGAEWHRGRGKTRVREVVYQEKSHWQFCTKSDIFLIFFKNGKNIQIDYKYFIVYSYFPYAYTDLVETINTG